MISILIPHKLRSRVELEDGKILHLFPNMINSLKASIKDIVDIKFELIIADFGSDDYPLLKWLDTQEYGIKTTVLDYSQDPIFNRGRALNIAAKQANGDLLCLMDTDMLLGKEFWEEGLKAINANLAYFPVCYSYSNPEHTEGWWRTSGYGMSIIKKEWFNEVGGIKENHVWGREDDDFVRKIARITKIYRPMVPNYFHQYHDNSLEFKNKFIK